MIQTFDESGVTISDNEKNMQICREQIQYGLQESGVLFLGKEGMISVMIDEETLREDNLFLLENDNYFMVFKGRKSKIVIPLKYIETMFNSDITITTDKLAIYVISKTLFNDDKRLLDYFKNNYIKLSTVSGEYIYDEKVNSDNYSVVAIRKGTPYFLTEELVQKSKERIKTYTK